MDEAWDVFSFVFNFTENDTSRPHSAKQFYFFPARTAENVQFMDSRLRHHLVCEDTMRKLLAENGLSIVLAVMFLTTWIGGQTLTGYAVFRDEQRAHGSAAVTFQQYLTSSHFLEATAENWESEFLQMFMYVLLTTFLYQKGSAESKPLHEKEPVDREPRKKRGRQAPWPVRRGGTIMRIYAHSLSLAFFLLFLFSFSVHAVAGAKQYSLDQAQHGQQMVSALQYITMPRFWFESFQNWQSEFLAILSMVLLSIFLREKGSPESKPVDAPHSQTGG
jgi:hypothetical protein